MHTVPVAVPPALRQCLLPTLAVFFLMTAALSGADIPPDTAALFSDNCTRCHGGLEPSGSLNLEPPVIFAQTVGRPSTERPELLIIAPGAPDKSYLVMKITAAPGITGRRMPPAGQLSPDAIAAITGWIASLDPNGLPATGTRENDRAFPGLTIGNTPTAEVLRSRIWYLRISHRFEPSVEEGYQSLYGFDGPAVMMLSFGAAVTGNLLMSLGRTNGGDALEWSTRYHFGSMEKGGVPLSFAFQTVLGWETEENTGRDRYSADAVSYTFQMPVTGHLTGNSVIVLAPGILLNPNTRVSDEDPLVTIGLAGKLELGSGYALIGDWTPIVSGFASLRTTYGFYDTYRRYDSWTLGLEKTTVSHIFQLFATNAEGIAAAQSLNGGDLRLQDGEMRFGFEIYRLFGL